MGVFLFDLIRTTRRGRPILIRSIFGFMLLLALVSVFGLAADVPLSESARLAQRCAEIFLFMQLAAVMVLTPTYAAGAITDERQRRTLDDLLVSDLTSREIVLGKLAARGLHVLAVMFVGLPVLSLVL